MTKMFFAVMAILPAALAGAEAGGPDAAAALRMLEDGNRQYVRMALAHPHQDAPRRNEVAKGQHPFAAILSCADSRVPPEILFDQGLGDLFVVRVAGNVAESATTGSLEYAAEHLHVPVLVVLGHEGCGAVHAAVEGAHAPGPLKTILDAIHPAVLKAARDHGDRVENVVTENVKLVVGQLRQDPVLSKLVASGNLTIVGAKYSLESGQVTFLK